MAESEVAPEVLNGPPSAIWMSIRMWQRIAVALAAPTARCESQQHKAFDKMQLGVVRPFSRLARDLLLLKGARTDPRGCPLLKVGVGDHRSAKVASVVGDLLEGSKADEVAEPRGWKISNCL